MEPSASLAVKSNLQIVQEAFANFQKGNIPAIVTICTEDVVWSSAKVPDVPFSGMFFGKEGVLEFFNYVSETIELSVFEPREFYTQGDDVLVIGHEKGVVKSTGLTFEIDWCMHFKLKDGKISRYFHFGDTYLLAKAFRRM